MCLPSAHAVSECDTTSAVFGTGKVKYMKILQSSQNCRSNVLIFGDTDISNQELRRVGEQSVANLYKSGTKAPRSLDELRYLHNDLSKVCRH